MAHEEMAHEDMALPMELFPGRFVRSACLPGASEAQFK